MPAGTPYYMDLSVATVLKSLAYYSSLVFGADLQHGEIVWTVLLIVLAYAVVRRRALILFGFGVFVLTLLPVCLIPNNRSTTYPYGPQIFLLLAVVLFIQEVLDGTLRRNTTRQWAGLCAALVLLTAATEFRKGDYFRARLNWIRMVRASCDRSASCVRAQLSNVGPSSHIYVNSGSETPWLFAYGDCLYLHVLRREMSTHCIVGKPERELSKLYERDLAEKYFVDYAPDGRLTLRSEANALAANKSTASMIGAARPITR
jgi:hypothetical protein